MSVTILFVLLFALAVWSIIHVRGHWGIKAVMILAIPVVLWVMYGAVNSYRGYPKHTGLNGVPSQVVFLSCLVEEPKDIYLWAIPLSGSHGVLDYRPKHGEPRSYRLPYSRSLHKACETADKQVQQSGVGSVGIRRKQAKKRGHRTTTFIPYILPPPHLPPKGHS